MRVAQIVDGLYVGGAEKLLVTFSEVSPNFGITPTVIPLRIYPETPFLDQLKGIHTPVVEFRGRNLVDPFRFFRLVRYLRREKFDVVHVHLTYAIVLGSLAAKLSGIPVVASVHNTQADKWAGLELFALEHWVDVALAVGHEVAKAYQPRLKGKHMQTVLNAVNAPVNISSEERLTLRTELGTGPNEVLILAVGRLFPQKGYDDLVSAMSVLKQRKIPVHLAIAGIGELREFLASRIEELGLGQMVKLLGSRRDVPKLLAASDIFANSSHWEGLPIAVLEAMAAGLPVAATSVGDVSHIINEENGILVPPRQPTQLADALQRLCLDAHLRKELGSSAKMYANQHHSPEAWVKQLSEIYQNLVRLEN
jgi:glycosyltransferase involved in cell wall biosynthesis